MQPTSKVIMSDSNRLKTTRRRFVSGTRTVVHSGYLLFVDGLMDTLGASTLLHF